MSTPETTPTPALTAASEDDLVVLGDPVLGGPLPPDARLASAALARRMGAPGAGLDTLVADLRGPARDREQQLEALLFSTQFPLTVAEIAAALACSEDAVSASLARLERALTERPTAVALFVREKAGQRAFILDLKTAFRADVAAVAPPLLKPALTETLALIAINQPLPQARLVRERGSTVYEHVKELMDRGLVQRQRRGRNFLLRTTDTFAAEFGLDNDPELIRRALARAAGVQGTPEVVGSPRLHWDGTEAAEGKDPAVRAAELVAEARAFVPPPAPPAVEAAVAPVVEAVAAPAEVPSDLSGVDAKQPVEDCVVSGGEPPAVRGEEGASAPVEVVMKEHVAQAPRSDESTRLRREKAEAESIEARAKVQDLMSLIQDQSTSDDW